MPAWRRTRFPGTPSGPTLGKLCLHTWDVHVQPRWRGATGVDERWVQLDQAVSAAKLLGYLNYSDGRPDPRWQKQVNDAFAFLADHHVAEPWRAFPTRC